MDPVLNISNIFKTDLQDCSARAFSNIFPKNTFSMLVPIWDPLGPPKKSIDHFWHPLDAALAPEHASRTASGPSKNRSKQKMELLKNTGDFPQKLSPGELLAIQAPPQTGPMDLHTRPEGPLRAS